MTAEEYLKYRNADIPENGFENYLLNEDPFMRKVLELTDRKKTEY